MTWLAIIPLKGLGQRKTRLASRLSEEDRRRLSDSLFVHVADVLAACPQVSEVALLSHARPDCWRGCLFQDDGLGLNAELERVANDLAPRPLLAIHADLPLVSPQDVAALLKAATDGIAIAPDRRGGGTNALALRNPSEFQFAFGVDSLARHEAAANGRSRVVIRPGLNLDIDTPEDLDAAMELGFSWPGGLSRKSLPARRVGRPLAPPAGERRDA